MNERSHLLRRFLSTLLIATLILVQAGLLVHEVEHAAMGDSEHCVSCWVADHNHGIASKTISLVLPQFPGSTLEPYSYFIFPQPFSHYASRAPPVSNFS